MGVSWNNFSKLKNKMLHLKIIVVDLVLQMFICLRILIIRYTTKISFRGGKKKEVFFLFMTKCFLGKKYSHYVINFVDCLCQQPRHNNYSFNTFQQSWKVFAHSVYLSVCVRSNSRKFSSNVLKLIHVT